MPIGHVPRQIRVLARGVNTRRCAPGDIVTISGVYMPAPFTGFKRIRAGLSHDTYIESFRIVKDK